MSEENLKIVNEYFIIQSKIRSGDGHIQRVRIKIGDWANREKRKEEGESLKEGSGGTRWG